MGPAVSAVWDVSVDLDVRTKNLALSLTDVACGIIGLKLSDLYNDMGFQLDIRVR